jgi:hypothetical protein
LFYLLCPPDSRHDPADFFLLSDIRTMETQQSNTDNIDDRDARIAKLETLVDELKAIIERQQISIMHLWGAEEELRQSISRIKAENALELGRLPPMNELDEVRCQVWCKEGKWSLRLGITANGRRWKNERNIALLSARAFNRSIKRLKHVPERVKGLAQDALCEMPDVVFGMLREKTTGKGTPYITDQVAFMAGHAIYDGVIPPDMAVRLLLGDDTIYFDEFRLAKGDNPNSAMYYTQWRNSRFSK